MAGEFSILSNIDAFLLGMDSASRKPKKGESFTLKDLETFTKQTVSNLDNDFRSVYDRLMPNIHVLDASVTAKLLLDALYNTPEDFLNFNEINTDPAAGPITGLSKATKLEVQGVLTASVRATITKKVIAAISALHKKVLKPTEPDPIYALNASMEAAFNNLHEVLISDKVINDAKIKAVFDVGSTFKKSITNIFGNRAIIGVINKDLGSSDTVFVFYASSFNGSKTRINTVIADAFTTALKESSNISKAYNVSTNIQTGTYINFAHSTVKVGTHNFLNSPSYAKLMYNVAQNPARSKRSPFSEAMRASEHFKKMTGQIKLGVKVEKTFADNTNILAQLGVTLTVSGDEAENKAMGALEALYGSGIYKSAQKATQAFRTSMLVRQLERIAVNIVGGKDVIHGSSSPTIFNYLEKKFLNSLTNKATVNSKYTTEKQKAIQVDYLRKGTKTKIGTVNLPKPNTVYPSTSFPTPRNIDTGRFISLSSIQGILNANLADQIQKNMGSGNRKDILNYQTGRLANSAHVDRMSMSKEGMITAFYTYMRNPYGTFSDGGAQSSPKTRDPKLLISKSIREIAATIAANRMRAVLV